MSFTIAVTGTYTREEIPPRCRKPRPVTYNTSTTVEVPTVTADEAPVAFRVRDIDAHINEIRTYEGRLFAPYRPASQQTEPTTPGDTLFPQEVDAERRHLPGLYSADSDADFADGVQSYYRSFLIIDGTVWAGTSEPGYLVTTFGMGGINGSTGLMVSSRTDHGQLFRADEFEQARACAAEISRERGDRQEGSYEGESAERYRAIEVVIPEAVTLVTVPPVPKEVRDMRFAYRVARDRLSSAWTPDEETETFAEVVRLREEIIGTGHAPVESDARPYEARHEAQETR